MSFKDIEREAAAYSKARGVLAARLEALRDKLAEVKRAATPAVRTAVSSAMTHQAKLRSLIEAEPELFAKPKTQILYGIKVGFQQTRERLEWTDTARVLDGIRKLFPEQADVLIQTTEKPVDAALRVLAPDDLQRIGVEIVGGEDEVIIKPADAAVDWLLNQLLKDELEKEEA
jgi:hypothetical protein